MAWAPIIAAGIGAGGSLLGGMMSASGQQGTNAQMIAANQQSAQFNAEQADIARRDAYNFAGTAYQRAVGDMHSAGLNPILALGSPATATGGGQMGNAPGSPSLGNPGAGMGAGVSSAAEAGQKYAAYKAVTAQAEKDESTKDLNATTSDKQKAETVLTNVMQDKAKQDTATSAAQEKAAYDSALNSRAQAGAAGASAAYDYAKTVTEGHNATSARHTATIKAAEAENASRFGPGVWGNAGAAATRSAGTAIEGAKDAGVGAWNWYSRTVGKPFSDAVGSIIDKSRSPVTTPYPAPAYTRNR